MKKEDIRRCVVCNRIIKGESIMVNVYDKVLGRGNGVECGRKNCKLKIGSPKWIKFYWVGHFLDVIYRPDYFGKFAYRGFWKEIKEFCQDEKNGLSIKKRINKFPIDKIFKQKYPNKWDK